MNRNMLRGLLIAFVIAVVVDWIVISAVLARGWIHLSPDDLVAGRIVFYVIGAVLPALICMMVGIGVFVYRDARQRGMPPVVWTLVALFVPYFVGVIVYLIVRQSRAVPCPSCGRGAPLDALFCPQCGRPVQQACARCGGRIPSGARFCPGCGAEQAVGAGAA